MSMLTAQVDRLRETVSHIRDTFVYTDLDGVPRIPPTAADVASQMEEAADTIEDLRARLTENEMCNTNDYVCPQCGTVMDYVTRGDDDEKVIPMDDYVIPLHYCPNCGRKVVE